MSPRHSSGEVTRPAGGRPPLLMPSPGLLTWPLTLHRQQARSSFPSVAETWGRNDARHVQVLSEQHEELGDSVRRGGGVRHRSRARPAHWQLALQRQGDWVGHGVITVWYWSSEQEES